MIFDRRRGGGSYREKKKSSNRAQRGIFIGLEIRVEVFLGEGSQA